MDSHKNADDNASMEDTSAMAREYGPCDLLAGRNRPEGPAAGSRVP